MRKASTLAQDVVSKFNIQTRAEPSRIQVTVGARPCTCSGKKIAKAMKRTIGSTCGPLGPGEAPSFAPTVSEPRPLPDANRVIWLDNFGRRLGGTMEEQQIGWIAAIIIGGIAGWLAEQFMKSQWGL